VHDLRRQSPRQHLDKVYLIATQEGFHKPEANWKSQSLAVALTFIPVAFKLTIQRALFYFQLAWSTCSGRHLRGDIQRLALAIWEKTYSMFQRLSSTLQPLNALRLYVSLNFNIVHFDFQQFKTLVSRIYFL
jgi:hypothetical protein